LAEIVTLRELTVNHSDMLTPNFSRAIVTLKSIGKSKPVKGRFSRLQWHLEEGWRIWFSRIWMLG